MMQRMAVQYGKCHWHRIYECFVQEVNHLKNQWSSIILQSATRFAVFCTEMAAHKNQHCCYWLEIVHVICGLWRRSNIFPMWIYFEVPQQVAHPESNSSHWQSFWKCLHTSSHRQLYYKYSKRKQKEDIRKYGHNKFLDVGFDFVTLTAKHYEAQQLRK